MRVSARRVAFAFPVACAVITVTTLPALSDTVRLENGDSIHGTVTELGKDTLRLHSDILGDLKIPRKKIVDLAVNHPVGVTFDNGYLTHGRIARKAPGVMRLYDSSGEEVSSFSMAQLAGIAATEKKAKEAAAGWETHGSINLGATINTGNTESELYHADGEFKTRHGQNRFTGHAEADLEKDDQEETTNRALLQLQYDRFMNEKWYLYTSGGLQHDSEKNLIYRGDLGAGAGYQFIETKRADVSVEGGPSYIVENFDPGEDSSYPAFRLSADLRYDPVPDAWRLFHHNELFTPLASSGDMVLRTRTGVRYFMGNGITATAEVDYNWESDPPAGNVNADTIYLFTLGYTW